LDAQNKGTGLLLQPDTDEDKEKDKEKDKDKEIASAARTLLLAALTIVLLPPLIAYLASVFHLMY
jgi:hypothetical protein